MNLLIRADSSSQIGLGHIMRDIVLAQHYPDDTILFACRDLPGNIIDSIPYGVHILTSNEPEELIDLIRTCSINLLIIDHYDIDATMEKQIKKQTGVSLLCLDDTYEQHYCDILLNHNISADKSRYEGLVPSECEIRCGSEYTLIRDEFKTEKQKEREKQYDIFISIGGTDPTNVTLDILKTLSDSYRICIVTTSGNPNLGVLEIFVRDRKNISLQVNSKSVAKLLHESRLALITPSVMVHEVLFMETPFIAIKTADNQKDMFEYLQKEKYTVLEEWDVNAITRFYNT
jgi:UDP-2,4-diacetamido-2,4,6-trideoxy-beta-L-altropyranose hydrolase